MYILLEFKTYAYNKKFYIQKSETICISIPNLYKYIMPTEVLKNKSNSKNVNIQNTYIACNSSYLSLYRGQLIIKVC